MWGAGGSLLGAMLATLLYGGQWAAPRIMAWVGTIAAPILARVWPSIQQSAQRVANVWNQPWSQRGRDIEDAFGRTLARNFPGIDRFVDNIATSIKSLDLTAPTYQNLSALTGRVQAYIRELSRFQGARDIAPNMIMGRELILVIPSGSGTLAQWEVLQSLYQYAQTWGVILIGLTQDRTVDD